MTIWRLRLVFLALAVALALPGALLVRRALASVAFERDARDRAVAERAFDEMERALTELLRIEEERAASDYDFERADSPLREPPRDSLASGYFQIEADGRVSAPAWAAHVLPMAARVATAGERLDRLPARSPPAAPEPQAPRRAKRASGEGLAAAQDARAPAASLEPRSEPAPLAEATANAAAPTAAGDEGDAAFAAKDAPARDAYDALAKLNTAAKQREQRAQRVYEEEQPAPATAPIRETQVAAEGSAGVASRDLAVSGEAVAQAPPEPRVAAEALVASALASDAGKGELASHGSAEATAPKAEALAAEPEAASADGRLFGSSAPRPAEAPVAREERKADREARGRSPESAVLVAPEPAPRLARSRAPAAALPPARVRIVVDPLRGRLAASGELLLIRTVWIGGQAIRQGLALDLARLERALTERTLGAGALPGATLRVAARAALPSAQSAYSHRFAEPFEALGARLELAPFADPAARSVYWLTALLTLAAVVGLAAVYRMVSVALHFAQRRSNFAAAVSHELKTPLTAIRMYAEMLRDGLVANDGKRAEYYRSISSEAERLSRLIDNVLEFSRLERGTRTLELRVGDVGAVAREAIELLRPHAGANGLALELAIEDGLPPVRFERDALLQVLFNLVDNAIKYGRGGTARIEVACRRAGTGVALSVRDHGPGVPREELGRIFEPFYRRGDELTRSAPGAGIGLALVRGLAEQMGAALDVRNAEGGGLCATLALEGAAA
jgi:signal transduction histidine kinase